MKQIRQDQASIGQSPEVEVCLDGENILPWHALVEKSGDGYVISDLGSTAGTFVNERKIVETPLKTGDRIQIGDFFIEFFIGVPYLKSAQKPSPVKEPAAEAPAAAEPEPEKKPAAAEPAPEPEKEPAAVEPAKAKKLKKPRKKKTVKKKAAKEEKAAPPQKEPAPLPQKAEPAVPPPQKEPEPLPQKAEPAAPPPQKEPAAPPSAPPEDLMRKSFRANPWKETAPLLNPLDKPFAPPSFSQGFRPRDSPRKRRGRRSFSGLGRKNYRRLSL